MRAFWDTNVLVSAAAFPNGTAGHALEYAFIEGWENYISLWVAEECQRILTRKLNAGHKWPELQNRFRVLGDAPHPVVVEISTLIRDPFDAPIVAVCTYHPIDVLVAGDKDLTDDEAVLRLLDRCGVRVCAPSEALQSDL